MKIKAKNEKKRKKPSEFPARPVTLCGLFCFFFHWVREEIYANERPVVGEEAWPCDVTPLDR